MKILIFLPTFQSKFVYKNQFSFANCDPLYSLNEARKKCDCFKYVYMCMVLLMTNDIM